MAIVAPYHTRTHPHAWVTHFHRGHTYNYIEVPTPHK